MQKNNTSGYKNIFWRKDSNKWRIIFRINGINNNYGQFQNLEDAIIKREQIKNELNSQGNKFN